MAVGRNSVSERDLRSLRRLANPAEWHGEPGSDEPLMAMLGALAELIACESISFGMVDSEREAIPFEYVYPTCGDPDVDVDGSLFFKHYWKMPACCYPDVTGDLDRLLLTSDFYTVRAFRNTDMYNDYIKPTGCTRYMFGCVAGRPGRTLRLLFWRGPGPDFNDRDQTILEL